MKKDNIIYIALTVFGILFIIFIIKNWKLIDKSLTFMSDAYKYSTNVSIHLNRLNPYAKPLFEKFIQGVIALGYTPQINSSYRSFAEQQVQYNANPSNAKAGYSYHNYGLAIDMQVSKNGKVWGKATSDADWMQTGIPQLAKSLGLTWGGDNAVFGNYQDAVHFDWRVKKTTELLAMAKNQFGSNEIKGNELKIV